MIRFAAVFVLSLLGVVPGLAFDEASQAAIDGMKRGKAVPITAVTELMKGAQMWCYNQRENECAWSDIYLSISGNDVEFEMSHPWNDLIDISYINRGALKDNRFICGSGYDWIPSVRAYERGTGYVIGGRTLAALKLEVEQFTTVQQEFDCFDYVFEAADDEAQTVTLLQRQYEDGETDPANDATVTLHFDQATAADLGWYW
ncbi:hypothetical protein [Devosia rhizoryzae]|uniref:Uncharacterized protein n=1 Tax=Devosia rhizoryzae TaxID=2774137 RepID=A0ABX7C849_9HYPH|nr:hypothetical protein [Devosia rhizoryzae]QQR38800.1 hypothetical protein JI748_13730 [Devosia rhizoryzae]